MCESRTPHMNESHSNMCPKTCIHELRRGKSYKLHTWVSHELHTWTSHTVICAPKHVYTNFPKHVYTNFVEEWGTNYTHEWVTNSTHVTYIGARFAVNKTAIRAPILPVHEWVTNFICEWVTESIREWVTNCICEAASFEWLFAVLRRCCGDLFVCVTWMSHDLHMWTRHELHTWMSYELSMWGSLVWMTLRFTRTLLRWLVFMRDMNESRTPYVNELRTAYVRQPRLNDSSLSSDVAALTCFYVWHEWVTIFICERVTNSIREW